MKRFVTPLLSATLLAFSCAASADPSFTKIGFDDVELGISTGAHKWVDTEHMRSAQHLKAGEDVSVYRLDKRMANGAISQVFEEAAMNSGPMFKLRFNNGSEADESYLVTTAQRDIMPRTPTALSTNNAVYQDVVKKQLAKLGIKNAPIKIRQLYRVDLEGKGAESVIIAASNIKTWKPEVNGWKPGKQISQEGVMPAVDANSYSIIIVRQFDGQKVTEHVIDYRVYPKASSPESGNWTPPSVLKVEAMGDLDGNGTYELIISSTMYEGIEHSVYDFQKNRWKAVLAAGYGA